MFHHSEVSLTRTQRQVIHNNENAISTSSMNGNLLHKSSSKNVALGPHSNRKSNKNGIYPSSDANVKAVLKTVRGTNSRRKALGDISNRKGAAFGSTHVDASSNVKSKKKNETNISIYTPHKDLVGKKASKHQSSGLSRKTRTEKNVYPSSNRKKKNVSFAIHTNSDDKTNVNEISNKAKTSMKRRNRPFGDKDDIELSAGRSW